MVFPFAAAASAATSAMGAPEAGSQSGDITSGAVDFGRVNTGGIGSSQSAGALSFPPGAAVAGLAALVLIVVAVLVTRK